MADQASRLRLMARMRQGAAQTRARMIAVTSGKGGVGKTNVTVNLALALIRRGKKVVLLDADLGLANADLILGESPPFNLGHVIRGEKELSDVIFEGPEGLRIVAGGSGLAEVVNLRGARLERFLNSLRQMEKEADIILLDTAAGISESVLGFVLAADEVILVVTPEPTSLTDAYAIVKNLVFRRPDSSIGVVINRVGGTAEAQEALVRLKMAVKRFLNKDLHYLGHLPDDPAVVRAVKGQRPFVLAYPASPAARGIARLAEIVDERAADQAAGPEEGEGLFVRVASFLAGVIGR